MTSTSNTEDANAEVGERRWLTRGGGGIGTASLAQPAHLHPRRGRRGARRRRH
ncbi:hypothetical protein [Phytohabitans houttuyneae]|uniref:hypothetical protein n=1 Tax=Phytohabitans houttuyneae TaxID=1076126 RepID=UPI0015636547|nr:hypothetical protein [Phytohabitans houttuyneae]